MIVTRILYSDDLNQGKFDQLVKQAKRLGIVRSEVWQRFGSVAGVGLKDRKVRDQWIKEKRDFGVLANPWKETLRDAMGDINTNKESGKKLVQRAIRRHTQDKNEQKRLYISLKYNKWVSDPYLGRMMRKYCPRGHNHTHDQIVVRSDGYTVFKLGGRIWIKIPGLVKRELIAIPLKTKEVDISGTLRLILRNGKVEVHYTVETNKEKPCGTKTIGVDKGYTEVLTDSDGEHHGTELGKVLTKESDQLKDKYVKRNKIKSVADKLRLKGNNSKADKIVRKNLGRKKLDERSKVSKEHIRTIVFSAFHKVVNKAEHIVCEDLTAPMSKSKFGKNMNRRLSSWTKGVIVEAMENISQRRGSTLHYVNSAYTSQMDSMTGLLQGKRVDDKFYHANGEVGQSDINAARNILARLSDQEIGRWTPYKQVKSILLKRGRANRLKLLNQDSSCRMKVLSTESELPNGQLCPTF